MAMLEDATDSTGKTPHEWMTEHELTASVELAANMGDDGMNADDSGHVH